MQRTRNCIFKNAAYFQRMLSSSITTGPEVTAAFERAITPDTAQHLDNYVSQSNVYMHKRWLFTIELRFDVGEVLFGTIISDT